ncbi:hypothetical protein B0T24DRAFT_589573 [Lasiosphaeria ovina]|uniref:Uncharacterized protein n=1 Tax=Lasiosphaeria ovina TaxID=92902 RepID=A0AAE0KLK2_9PEZI|nr:hypothetical protein B0T24DRAFT_589573 [Lasiosphaeria ovina]
MSLDPWGRILGRASEKYYTDSRDEIYGTVGLLRRSTLDIQPDYTAPVAEIYKTAMLQHVKAVGRYPVHLWIPNWEVGNDGMFMSHNGWSASGFSSSSWTQPDANTLGYIREYYPTHDYWPSWRECRAHLWDHIEQIPDVPYPKGSSAKSRAFRMPPPRLFYGSDGQIGSEPADTEPGDVLAVFPGCPLPKILRPTENSAYEIVGSYKVCGLTYAEVFLGPVPETHYPMFGVDNYWVVRPLSVEGGERNDGMPLFEFTNTKIGEVRRTDPRMSIEALRARGVPFETFTFL